MEKAEKFQKERHFHGQLGKEFRENRFPSRAVAVGYKEDFLYASAKSFKR
jgi:hypothetical protein